MIGKQWIVGLVFVVAQLCGSIPVSAAIVMIDARSNIFEAGDTTAQRGLLPVEIQLAPYTQFVEVTSTGWTKAGGPWPVVGADGGTQGPLIWQTGTNIFSADGISGIRHNRFLFLTGVFLSDDSPMPGIEPARLDFSVIGSNFSDLSPIVAQSFFVGDGLTGEGSGVNQRFLVPTGATRLFLGFADSDSFGLPNGRTPYGYADNTGALYSDVQMFGSSVPEPTTLALWSGLGIMGLIAARRRKRTASAE